MAETSWPSLQEMNQTYLRGGLEDLAAALQAPAQESVRQMRAKPDETAANVRAVFSDMAADYVDPETGNPRAFGPLIDAATGFGLGKGAMAMGGIFAGRKALTANKRALGKAMTMEGRGTSRDEIWKETGWFKDVDGQWKFEIDDSAMRLTDESPIDQTGRGVAGPESAIQHPDLAEAYPELATMEHLISGKGSGGYLETGQPYKLVSRSMSPAQRRSTAIHEMQHAAQEHEGFAQGGNMEEIAGRQYRNLAGEAESRNVQARRNFTPEQRTAQPPWQTLDVPEEKLIVRMLMGGA